MSLNHIDQKHLMNKFDCDRLEKLCNVVKLWAQQDRQKGPYILFAKVVCPFFF